MNNLGFVIKMRHLSKSCTLAQPLDLDWMQEWLGGDSMAWVIQELGLNQNGLKVSLFP